MEIITYDGTFEGFLTAIFECYSRNYSPVDIISCKSEQRQLFVQKRNVQTESAKADRVWKGIQQKMTVKNKEMLFYAFLSEEAGVEMKIYRFVRRLFREHYNIETDFGDSDVLYLTQASRRVKQEAMRMLQFVRFQHTRDGLYFCGIEPRYDVIPLVVRHFQNRFADQHWLLFDLKRNYGVMFDKEKPQEVTISAKEFSLINGQISERLLEEGEIFYQRLWKTYFTHINIQERKNLKLQRQHMPRRFWKYLPEMMILN